MLLLDKLPVVMACGIGGFYHVRIKNNDFCWKDRREFDREILLFHELGHAILNREHVPRSDGNKSKTERPVKSPTSNNCCSCRLANRNLPC